MSDNNELPLSNPFAGRVGLNFEGAEPVNVWVDSIAGMSVELADNLRGEDAQALWARMQPVVYERFASRLESILSKRSAFRHIIARSVNMMPRVTGDYVTVTKPRLLVSAVAEGSHVKLRLGPLTCVSGSAGPRLLVIEDVNAEPGTEPIYSETVTLRPGQNTLLRTGVELPLVSYVTALRVGFGSAEPTQLRMMAWNDTTDWHLAMIPHVDSPYNVFHLNVDAVCDFSSIIERYADRLDWAYAYQCAHYLLDEKLSSNLMNVYTNTNRDDTVQRRDDYKADIDTLIGQACAVIVRDMEAGASPFLFVDESTQPGLHMGGYV